MEVVSRPAGARPLWSARAVRIVEAMRESVAEVGVAGSTFERVARKASVSRGLLHYYFGSKERLLVEAVRLDTEERVRVLGASIGAATSVDDLIVALSEAFERTLHEQSVYVYMVSELYVAGREDPELQEELGALYGAARTELAEILREKEREGVVRLRFDAEATLAYLFGTGDGLTIQRLTDPTLDVISTVEAGVGVARWLLLAD